MSLTFDEFQSQYHLQLTPQQQKAVQAVDGPVLVLAVPGAGKTTVLIARLGYMLLCVGIRPQQILTVTYTVAATKDMRRRFSELFGSDLARQLEFRTINGICAKIIAAYGRRIDKTPFTLQTDEGTILQILREFYVELTHTYPTESELMDLRSQISYIKNMQFSKEQQKALDDKAGLPLSEICMRYSARMRSLGQMDYDDQMVYARAILLRCPELVQQLQQTYRYICVDEAQDTSSIQHEILRILAKGPQTDNLFLVGDEDQSIYGFRAACPQALLEFEQQHADARILLMEDNFRSDASIVGAANRLIAHNKSRRPKVMRAVRSSNTQVRLLPVARRQSQYTYLLKTAESNQVQTAVLYRNNESALPLIDLLDRNGLPYTVRSADLSFFTSRVVCDISNICRFLRNPNDTETFLQIYYKLNLYLTKQSAYRCCEASAQDSRHRSPLSHLLIDPNTEDYVKSAVRNLLKQQTKVTEGSAEAALSIICTTLGYSDYLKRTESGQGKMAILSILAKQEESMESLFRRLDYLRDCMKSPAPQTAASESGLADVDAWDSRSDVPPAPAADTALQCGSAESGKRNTSGGQASQGLILSTIHASKGLEYTRVYLLDVGDGIFPAMDPPDRSDPAALAAYEEERRIFYVGITRARDYLNIFTLPAGSHFAEELQQDPQDAAKAVVKHPSRNPLDSHLILHPDYHSDSLTGSAGNSHRRSGGSTRLHNAEDIDGQKAQENLQIQENLSVFLKKATPKTPVIHTVYGPGVIQNITDNRIRVLFATGEERPFDLQIVVGKGILRLGNA